jgi:16S rRNA (guanine966-N2)-methyltransferase
VRIISGSAKGRKLGEPANVTRPTSDRAREGIFSALISSFGTFEGLRLLDLFAGSGAIGLEAISRGATEVNAIDKNQAAVDCCLKNYELVKQSGATGKFTIHKQSAKDYLQSIEAVDLSEKTSSKAYEIIFIDPPYELANAYIIDLLQLISNKNLLKKSGEVIVERDDKWEELSWPKEYEVFKERSYGRGRFLLARLI